MSLTAIVFVTIYFVGLILTFYRPYYGVLTYIFEWHNHPPYFWWGDELPDLRWSYTIALATLISFFLNRNKFQTVEKPDFSPAIWIVLIVLNMFVVSYMYAILPEISMEKTYEVLKMLVFFLLLVVLVKTYPDYRGMIWVIILCAANMGFIAWQEGSNRDIGVIAPNATEENALSAHIMAVMPFMGIYFLRAKKLGKIIIALSVPFCLNLIILANSRATLVGLLAIGFLSIFLVKGKYRMVVLLGVLAAGFLFTQLTNEQFEERQSMETYDDGSASSRLWIWEGGWRMWKDHPMGVGGGGFVELSMDYIPEIDKPKSQHNTFVAIFTDWGFIGILLYLGFMIHIFKITFRIKRRAKIPELNKYSLEATAIQLGLVGLIVAGLFHSRQYSEVVYWLCGFAIILDTLQRNELVELQAAGEAEPAETVLPVLVNGNGASVIDTQGTK